MITVSEAARTILLNILDDAIQQHPELSGGTAEPGLRLLIEDDGATFALDYPQDEDLVIDEKGRPLLIIAPETREILGDSTIDIIQSPEGDQLSIQREISSNGHKKEAA